MELLFARSIPSIYIILLIALTSTITTASSNVDSSNSTITTHPTECYVTYHIYDTVSKSYYWSPLNDGDSMMYQPCLMNIEAVIDCPQPYSGTVRLQLLNGTASTRSIIKRKTEQYTPYYLYGNNDKTGKVHSAMFNEGTYTIRATVPNRTLLSPSVTFTLHECLPR